MIHMRIKNLFFDRQRVISAVDKATRQVLSRFGAFVRTTAKSSIRRRKRTSLPGQTPSSHTGLLKRFIFFGYEPQQRSVVIGPVKLNKSTAAPSVLEYGGVTTVTHRQGDTEPVTIAPRPYMGPAFDKETPKLPMLWRDSVK